MDANNARLRMLLIDVDDVASDWACVIREDAGLGVRPARTRGEFNVLLTKWEPNVLVADVDLPGVTGSELCVWVQGWTASRALPS
jgi:DNA-binding response OmpR family regulator